MIWEFWGSFGPFAAKVEKKSENESPDQLFLNCFSAILDPLAARLV